MRLRTWQASEHEEQAAVLAWAKCLENRYPELALLFSIPNAAKRGYRLASRMKAEGLKSGVPDLFLPCARRNAHGLFLEMKREKAPPSSITPSQLEWRNALRNQGYEAHFAFGAVDAISIIEGYLNGIHAT